MSDLCGGRKERGGYRALESGIEAGRLGRYEEALEHFGEAQTWAQDHGDQQLLDRVLCNRVGADFELGRIEEPRRELRRILLGSSDPENRFLAAYLIGRSYDLQKDYERAMFYARIARDRCLGMDRPEWLAWSHNQTGNLLLATSQIEEATQEFESALQVAPLDPSVERALILDNLGYCRLLQGDFGPGFGHLYESLRCLRRFKARRYEAGPRLSLCFGYLEIGRQRQALRHAEAALELAESAGDAEPVKYSYYLLGETYKQMGHIEVALGYFTRLQQRFYPEAYNAPSFLLALDVRGIINLKA